MSAIDDFYKIDLLHNGDFVAAPNGDFALAKGLVNLKQALFHRLITVPGSLVHRPLYGVGIKLWQNDVGSLARQRDLASRIKEQFEQDERVEELTGIIVNSSDSNGRFEITYKVKVSGGGLLEETVNPFDEVTS